MPRSLLAALALGLSLALSGCLSRAELNQARLDDLRYMTRVIGFAVDANELSLQSRLTILRAFEGDERYALLEAELGTIKDNEERLGRVRDAKRKLVSEGQRIMANLGVPESESAAPE